MDGYRLITELPYLINNKIKTRSHTIRTLASKYSMLTISVDPVLRKKIFTNNNIHNNHNKFR